MINLFPFRVLTHLAEILSVKQDFVEVPLGSVA